MWFSNSNDTLPPLSSPVGSPRGWLVFSGGYRALSCPEIILEEILNPRPARRAPPGRAPPRPPPPIPVSPSYILVLLYSICSLRPVYFTLVQWLSLGLGAMAHLDGSPSPPYSFWLPLAPRDPRGFFSNFGISLFSPTPPLGPFCGVALGRSPLLAVLSPLPAPSTQPLLYYSFLFFGRSACWRPLFPPQHFSLYPLFFFYVNLFLKFSSNLSCYVPSPAPSTFCWGFFGFYPHPNSLGRLDPSGAGFPLN